MIDTQAERRSLREIKKKLGMLAGENSIVAMAFAMQSKVNIDPASHYQITDEDVYAVIAYQAITALDDLRKKHVELLNRTVTTIRIPKIG